MIDFALLFEIIYSQKKGMKRNSSQWLDYRKIPCISSSKCKPPKPATLNHPSKYKAPGDLYLENCPQIQSAE